MSSKFETIAQDMVSNAPQPDADAGVIKEVDQTKPRKRGRPAGSKTASKPAAKSQEFVDYEGAAKGLNTLVFSVTATICGTSEAWPSEEREKVLDKALSRYLASRDVRVPPEMALLAAYSLYASEVLTKPTVLEKINARFGALKRFSIVNKLTGFFRRKKTVAPEGGEQKKGWLK